MPNHPKAMSWGALRLFPLELPIILGALLATGRTRWVQACVVVIGAFVLVLKGADYAMYEAYGRPVNLATDWFLAGAGTRLLWSSLGPFVAVLAFLGLGIGLLLVLGLVIWAAWSWARIDLQGWRRGLSLSVAFGFALLSVAEIGHLKRYWSADTNPPGAAFSSRLAYEHAVRLAETRREIASFQQAAAQDPYLDVDTLFDRIGKRDVLFIFMESYGRSSFDNPLYAATHLQTLRDAEQRLRGKGFAMRSGWLTSPITGGQSWLAHGTLFSGLKTADQGRYLAMLLSDRQSLFHLATHAGFRTGAVMPAITMAWPEGDRMGFETVLAVDDLGYQGDPFNWVTMPDQYTLARFADYLPADDRPDFLQVTLISSHAPWVPVPDVIPWEDVGDGTVFNTMAASGDTPATVWRDRDRVRDQYRKSVDYVLQTAMSYAERQQNDGPLMIILGDHQPAGFVAQIDSRDVPIHVIGPAEVVDHLTDWNWVDGLIPDADTPVWPMEQFRDRFIDAFTTAPIPGRSL
nr:sulfatase-like hydrolase/transferase [Actibacterium sp. 188UL27-1]